MTYDFNKKKRRNIVSVNTVSNSRVIKHYETASGIAFEVTLGQEEHTCFQALNVADVISCMHLERGIATHRGSKKGTDMSLKTKCTHRIIRGAM